MNTELLNGTYILISGNCKLGDHTANLKQDLEYLGFPSLNCLHKCDGHTENSLLIPNLPIGLAQSFAQVYLQESFITAHNGKATLIFTDTGDTVHANDYTEFQEIPDDNYIWIEPLNTSFTFNFRG
jgi:hypothetical protein